MDAGASGGVTFIDGYPCGMVTTGRAGWYDAVKATARPDDLQVRVLNAGAEELEHSSACWNPGPCLPLGRGSTTTLDPAKNWRHGERFPEH